MSSGGGLPRKVPAEEDPHAPRTASASASVTCATRVLANNLPGRACVGGAVELAVEADNVGALGIARRPGDRPSALGDLLHFAPRGATVGAAENAVADCEDCLLLARTNRESDDAF